MSDAVQLTDREVKLLANAMQCLPTAPQVDLTKLASISGYTNVGSARNAWAALIKKIGLKSSTTTNGGGGNAPMTPSSSVKKHAPDGGATAADTPASPAAQRAKRKAKQAGLADDDKDEGQHSDVDTPNAVKTKPTPTAAAKKIGGPKTKTKTPKAKAVKREMSPKAVADNGDEVAQDSDDAAADAVKSKPSPATAATKGSPKTKTKTPRAKTVKREHSPGLFDAAAARQGAHETSASPSKRGASVERGRRSTREDAGSLALPIRAEDEAAAGANGMHVDVGEGEDKYIFTS